MILFIAPLFKKELLLKERICSQMEQILSLWTVPYSIENHFYHIKWAPLNVTIFIPHLCNLSNGCYANVNICFGCSKELSQLCLFALMLYIQVNNFYTTLTNFSLKYLVMCKVYTDVGGIK